MTEDSPVRDLNILICTPCLGDPKKGMAWSVARAMAHFLTIPYEGNLSCDWELMGGSNLAQQRTQLVSRALNRAATHILWWDADIKAPIDVIPRLLNHSKTIVAVNYPTKEMTSRPTVYLDSDTHTGPLWSKLDDKSLVGNVARCGLGLMLIEARVYECIELPFFHFQPREPDYVLVGGEDHYFCDKVRKAGFEIFCDQGVSAEIAHCGDFEYTNEWAIRAEETRQAIYRGDGEPNEELKAAE